MVAKATRGARLSILKQRGAEARFRAMERAGSSRIDSAAWWPEIELLDNLGHTTGEIAKALDLSERRIRDIKMFGSKTGDKMVYPIFEPKKPEDLDVDLQKMLEFTADGFELFVNTFSDRPLPPHCKQWVEDFCINTNLLLNVPPRHAKTTIFAVWVPIWLLARNRDEQIILVSKTNRFAKDQAAQIAYNLRYNKKLTDAFGRFAPSNEKGDIPWRPSQGELMVVGRTRESGSGQFSIISVGVAGQIMGREATVLILDDITDPQVARSETQREEEKNWLEEQVFNRIQPGGRAAVIGQRVHFLDIYGHLSEQIYKRGPKKGQPLWKHINTPAVLRWPENDDDPGEVLWPGFWDFDALMDTYERVGDTAFSCMYQQEPRPVGSALVRPEWWDGCRDPNRRGYQGVKSYQEDEIYFPIARVASIDPSPTKFNGLVVADVPYSRGTFFASIIEVKAWEGGMRSIVSEIERTVDQYKLDYLIVEHSTFTSWLEEDPMYQSLKERVTVLPHNTGKNKGNPELGVETLGGDVEMGRISLPYKDAVGRAMSKTLEDEMNIWPHGKHDDALMALWFIKWNYRKLIPRNTLPTRFDRSRGGGWSMNKKHRDKAELLKQRKRSHG